jgi:hypothetical protein
VKGELAVLNSYFNVAYWQKGSGKDWLARLQRHAGFFM